MMPLEKMVDVLAELNCKTLEAELGDAYPLLLLVQDKDHVICCSNMKEDERIQALEELLAGWKADREAEKRIPAALLPSAALLQ